MLTVTFSPSYRPSHLPILLTVTSLHPTDHPISPFEGGWGDVNCQIVTSPRPTDRHVSPFEGSPRAGVAEYVQGGMLSISPFEGSPRAGAAEYVQRGDVNRQIC